MKAHERLGPGGGAGRGVGGLVQAAQVRPAHELGAQLKERLGVQRAGDEHRRGALQEALHPRRDVGPGEQAQLLAALGALSDGGGPKLAFATSARAVFLRPARPGDTLTLLGLRLGAPGGLVQRGVGQALVGDQVCAAVIMEAANVD